MSREAIERLPTYSAKRLLPPQLAMEEYYLLGIVAKNSETHSSWEGCMLLYQAKDQRVAIAEGGRPHDAGAIKDLKGWFAHRPLRLSAGENPRYEPEPPGWFDRICAQADCEWFLPLARRLAAGELVPLQDITQAYSDHHGGRVIKHGAIHLLAQDIAG